MYSVKRRLSSVHGSVNDSLRPEGIPETHRKSVNEFLTFHALCGLFSGEAGI
jgi:hypothetical protein